MAQREAVVPGRELRQVEASLPRRRSLTEAGDMALLQIWLSPAFPIGAFAYSHGLEWAAEKGWVRDRASLEAWLGDLLAVGGLRNDLILLAHSADTQRAGTLDALAEINVLALAFQPSTERHLETRQQGTSFLAAICAAWPFEGQEAVRTRLGPDVAYPVAVGIAVGGHGIEIGRSLAGYGLAFFGNLISAAIRLSVIGQTDGQRIAAALLPSVMRAAEYCRPLSLDELGGSAFRSDIASIAHETQYTRLFRS